MSLTRQSNKSVRILILIVGAVIVIWSVYQDKRPVKEAAEMEFRMVSGEKNGKFQVIMFETSDRFFVLDSTFRQTFEQNDAEVVSRPEHIKLLASYKNLQYRAGLSVGKEHLKKEVRLSRELFNVIRFNSLFSSEIHPKIQDSLLSISEIN